MRYATKDITADVEEEGGVITRQVAVAGQPVSPAFNQYVDDKDTTTDPEQAAQAVRSSSARRSAERPDERSHEEFRDLAQATPGAEEAPRPSGTESRSASRRRKA